MTIIEERAANSIVANLPRITRAMENIYAELIRANILKALSIRMGIEKSRRETKSMGVKKELMDFGNALKEIMKGIQQ